MKSSTAMRAVSLVFVAVLGCERPPESPAPTLQTTASTAAKQDEPLPRHDETEELGLGAVEETPQARAIVLAARLSPSPSRTQPLEDAAAEGAEARIWERDGQLQMVVFEFKGETYDSVRTIYFEHGAPFFARFYTHSDPAKMLEPSDEHYTAAADARQVEILLVSYLEGPAERLKAATVDVDEPATYDEGDLVEMRTLPPTLPVSAPSAEFEALMAETEQLLRQIRLK